MIPVLLAARLAVAPWLGGGVGFAVFILGVMAAAWYGGLGPGLAATVLSSLAAIYFLVPPFRTLRIDDPLNFVALGVFVSWGVMTSVLYERLRSARGRALAREEQLDSEIRQRREADERLLTANQQLHIVTDSMSAPVTRCSRDLRYLWASQPYADFIGRPAEEIIGRPIREIVGAAAFEQLRPHFDRVLAGERVEYEQEVPYLGRGERWVHAIYTPTRDASGAVDGWVAVVIDMHERKQLEEALRRADRRKDEFLATLAHELRNPLAPIRNAIGVLRLKGGGDAESAWSREVIERQVAQMSRLLDDLLELSRITSGKLELRRERVELAAVIRSAAETSAPWIEGRRHRLDLDLPAETIELEGDPIRLAQVFSNLLNNAAKYTDPGGRIWLTAGREAGSVLVSVKDSGIGISREMLDGVFDLFTQATPSSERSRDGLGIGLSLARRIVELHGGSIEARSEGSALGSEFVVRLPIVTSAAGTLATPAARAEKRLLTPLRLLVVDDNRDSADSLALLLRAMGHEVQLAYDGDEAIGVAAAFEPEVVLLDLGMPKLDGLDAARAIRGQPWAGSTVFVAMTGWGQEVDRRRSAEAGFLHHLVKPVDLARLGTVLERVAAAREPQISR